MKTLIYLRYEETHQFSAKAYLKDNLTYASTYNVKHIFLHYVEYRVYEK